MAEALPSKIKSKYDAIFNSTLAELNPQQREAVESIEGPVLVNAGPGTGKTQILAARIGMILQMTDASAHNILCLTFTDAATVAMRNRLVKIIGPIAHQIHIFTFHAFCNQVIQENLDIFGDYRQLESISDLESIDIFRELIDNLDKDNVLKRFKGDKYFEKGRMKMLFQLMKKENISPKEFLANVEEYLRRQKDSEEYIAKRRSTRKGKTYEKGDFRDDYYQEFERKFLELKSAIKEFDNFNKLMLEHERYDYDDMILWVLREFDKNEYLLMQYQERYQYFLVDEFQDTNGAQNAILDQLISYWDTPNVFVVGDDDQAIFKFQGANLRNLIEFKTKYNPHTIVLVENYRSNQLILDAAKMLISNNQERIIVEDPNLSKDIVASGEFKNDTTLPVINAFSKISEEYSYIASELNNIKDDKDALSNTAIIYRQHKQVEDLISILEKRNIAYNVKRRIDILKLPFVKKMINILNYISEEYQEMNSSSSRLFNILHYDFFELSAHDAARICHFSTHRKSNPELIKLRDIISREDLLDQINVKDKSTILNLSENLESWIKAIPNMTIQKLFEKILNEGNILSYIMKGDQRAWLLQLLGSFFDFIKNETAKDPDTDLKTLLSMLEKMKDNNIELFVNKNISSEQGVHFVTAHSAKGLEFQNVFILGCTKKIWESKPNSRGHYSYPEGVNSSSAINIEDERRLFYVAMTRAKTNLQISYSERSEDGKDLGSTQFIDQILEYDKLSVSRPLVKEEDLVNFYYEILRSHEKKISLVDGDLIDEWLKDYKLSVTHLNKYLDCPLSFYFENILRVPSARNPYTGFGNAMHEALRAFLENYKIKKLKDKEHLIYYFIDSMNKHRSHFTDEQFEDYLTLGKMTLDQIYIHRIDKWLKVPKFALEEELSHAEVNGIPIKGFLDKVEIYEQGVHVVDYKTGNADKGMKKTKSPSEKDPKGGDYWRQLVFYKILLDSDKKHNWNMTSAEIDFLEPDRKTGEFKYWKHTVTREDVEAVSKQITDCYKNIKEHKFDTGCGKDDCRWCNFVEEHDLTMNHEE